MTLTRDMEIGEVVGPACPCEPAGRPLGECDQHGDVAAISIAPRLRSWANTIAARFGAHVYLTGSALTKAEPRDIDIRVVLTADQYEARYGNRGWVERHLLGDNEPSPGMKRWMADVVKLGEWVTRHHQLNIDFQIQHEAEVRHYGYDAAPRIQLDDLDEYWPSSADGGEA